MNSCDSSESQLVIQQWYRRVYALCRSRLVSVADSEEATQETFVRAIARSDDLKSIDALGAWLRQIAKNVCVDTIRRQQVRRAESFEDDIGSRDQGLRDADDKEDQDRLLHLVHSLPEVQREVILLHYYESMTYDEMAEWLGVARSTINDRLRKARHSLKCSLELAENGR